MGYSATEIMFDLACWFSDDAEPNGYRVQNDNPNVRTISVAEDATAWRIVGDISNGVIEQVPYAEWVPEDAFYVVCPGEFCLVWIRTEAGALEEIVEQYVP